MVSGRDGLTPEEKNMIEVYWSHLNAMSNCCPMHAGQVQAMSASIKEAEDQRVKRKMHLSYLIHHDEQPDESAEQKHSINNPVPLLDISNNDQEERLETVPAGFPDCILCPKRFDVHSKLAEHIILDHGYPRLECPHCDYKCAKVATMKRHVRVSFTFSIFVDNLKFGGELTSSVLSLFQCVHDMEEKFHCFSCEYSSDSMLETKHHTRDQHSRCPYCQKAFERLGTHERECPQHPKHAYIAYYGNQHDRLPSK